MDSSHHHCDKKGHKGSFSSRLGFIAAALGAAVGLGNVWRFPYLAGAHGGAMFLLIYVLSLLLLGCPLMMWELHMGRRVGGGPADIYRRGGRFWRLVGGCSAFSSLGILSYYNVITGWIWGYLIRMLGPAAQNPLFQHDAAGYFQTFLQCGWLQVGCTLFSGGVIAAIAFAGVAGGIERVSTVLMPLFVVMLLGLIVYVAFLPGAAAGIRFYLVPDLKSVRIGTVVTAVSQAFMSLGVACGILPTYGAYAEKRTNFGETTVVVVIGSTLVSLMAGLFLFPVIFDQGINPSTGPALLFISLPEAFRGLGVVRGLILGVFFFFLMIVAAVTSAISLFEVVVAYLVSTFSWKRKRAIVVVMVTVFVLGLPTIASHFTDSVFASLFRLNGRNYSFFALMDLICLDIGLPLVGLLFCCFVWRKGDLGVRGAIDQEMGEKRWSKFLHGAFYYLLPVTLSILLLLQLIKLFD